MVKSWLVELPECGQDLGGVGGYRDGGRQGEIKVKMKSELG